MSSEKPGCLAALFGVRSRRTGSQPVSPSAPIPKSTSKPQAVTLPYRLSAKLLSPAEANFYRIIKQMVGEHLLIFPKMGLKEFLLITDQSNFQSYYNRIDRKHVDFLLCDPNTFQPVFAIELDDASHRQAERGQRDTFVETILAGANLPLVRVPVRASYDTHELGFLFKNAFQKREIRVASQENEKRISDAENNPPLCPTHGIPMILRKARQGSNAGGKFWGCANYPQCREIIKVT
ncbi:MAG TPA: DUF2726 domain-containing protein [Anaerolineales bacterium]|nr:DUF2726 domain-containing protein [Anaerolineales bacterium]